MDIFTLLLLGLGLAMDSSAVSVTNGIYYKMMSRGKVFGMALVFGLFQGLMPLIGYYAGSFFYDYICTFDHWIAFILLVFIGGKMVIESFEKSDVDKNCKVLTYKTLIWQGIATSIDALAVGVSFSAMNVNILQASFVITLVTLVCCYLSVYFGRAFGIILKQKAERVGGLILIGIGLKIFLEHMLEK